MLVKYRIGVVAYAARIARQSATSADVRWSLKHDGPTERRSVRAWAAFIADDFAGLRQLQA